MTSPRRRLPFVDLLAVQTVRRLENETPKYYPDIDLRLSDESKRGGDGHLTEPEGVLADRAGEILQTRYGFQTGWVGELVGWLKVSRVLGCILAFALAFSAAEPWLSDGEVVNVEWIFGFLITLVLSMAIATLLMVTAIFSRRGTQSEAGLATRSLSKLLVVHWVMSFLIRQVLPWVQRRILKREKDRTPEQVQQTETLSKAALETLSQQSRRFALETAATSNLIWLLISLGIFVSLGKMGLFREYNFRWRATIVSSEFMLESTRALSQPIQSWPMVMVPDAADVHWLTTGEIPAPPDEKLSETEIAEQSQAARQAWGRLFLAFVLYYGVLPRFLLTLISFALARRGWRELVPKTNEPYFRQILDWIESPPFRTEEHPSPQPPTPVTVVSPAPVSAPTVDDSPADADIETEPPLGNNVAVFGFDLDSPKNGWETALPLRLLGQPLDLGSGATRDSRKRILNTLAEQQTEIGSVVLVSNLTDNPDGLFEDFARKVVDALDHRTSKTMLLAGGERLRQRFTGDASKISARVELWTQRAVQSGFEESGILEYDFENATATARSALEDRLSRLAELRNGNGSASASVQSAGHIRKATALISGYASRDTAQKTEDELRSDAIRLHDELRGLYQKQASQLENAFRNVSIDTNRLQAAVQKTTGAVGGQFEKLEHLSRMSETIGRYTQRLSGKWAVAGGVLCGVGSGALTMMASPALIPAIVPAAMIGAKAGMLGGVVSAHAPHLAAKFGWSGDDAATETPIETETESAIPAFTLDDLVRPNALWALILEFQGTAEEQIARMLEQILDPLSDDPLTTSEQTHAWLEELARRTETIVAESTVASDNHASPAVGNSGQS
ncbi:DUF2868 domain-containing protein [Thalassoroseus pseudoceratinae]|uniref:DUF2868 domain-containing protein n=1 Tax=Thalassoroseus pseudoceratinae TaxID=2713176 RepID=UPI0014222BE3|nr:DUF2868 domain-containing protein [Thalassoroseus pseudoceratinae]